MNDAAKNLDEVTTEARGFEILDHYERLIRLRSVSPDKFLLQTSEAARRALAIYEQQKARHTESESE